MSIKIKIIIISVLLSIIPLLLITLVSNNNNRQMLLKQSVDSLTSISDLKSNELNNYFHRFNNEMVILQNNIELKSYIPKLETYSKNATSSAYLYIKKDLDTHLFEWIKKSEDIVDVQLLSPDGMLIYTANPHHEVHTLGKQYKNVDVTSILEKPTEIFVSQIFPSQSELVNTHFYYAAPIYDNNNVVLAIAVMQIDAKNLFALTKNVSGMGQTGEVMLGMHCTGTSQPMCADIYNKIGEEFVLYLNTPRFKSDVFYSPLNNDISYAMKEAVLGKSGEGQLLDYRNHSVIAHWNYIQKPKVGILIKKDVQEIVKPAEYSIKASLLIGFITVMFIITSTSLYTFVLMRPITILKEYADQISSGNYDIELDSEVTENNDELSTLSKAFITMVKSLNSSKEQLKLYAKGLEIKVKERTNTLNENVKELEDQQKAMLNILEDINKEKQQSQKQAETLRKFQAAVEQSTELTIFTDPDGIVLWGNNAIDHITGFTIKETVGRKAGVLWGKLMDKEWYQELWKTIKIDKKVFNKEILNHRKNGERFTSLLTIYPLLDSEGNVQFFVGTQRDVTKEKEVDRMKTDFISLASHQLKTPLSAIKWFLEMLIGGDFGQLTEKQNDAVKNINDSNERMIELVNSLLNISRIESGRIIVDPIPVNFGDLINKVVEELSKKVDLKKQKIITNIDSDIATISLDPKLIRQVVMNLLTNAMKYSPEGTNIHISVSKQNEFVCVKVEDHGYGIPHDEQSKIFERFYRATNVVKRETDGTGLGLYLVKSIVDSSGGKVWFESKEGVGTSFYFTLPLTGMKPKTGEVSLS